MATRHVIPKAKFVKVFGNGTVSEVLLGEDNKISLTEKFAKVFGSETVHKVFLEEDKKNISFFVYPIYGAQLGKQMKKLEEDYNVVGMRILELGLVLKITVSQKAKKKGFESVLRIAKESRKAVA